MRLQVNDKWITLPSTLRQITLKQRIDFQNKYGNQLIERSKKIEEIKDEVEKELASTQLHLDKVLYSLSFFTDCTVEAIKQSGYMNLMLNAYMNSIAFCFEEESKIIEEPQYEFIWNEAEWVLHVPEIKNGSTMTFGEFIDSKQIIQDMVRLGKNRWECLLPLCAIFLRKKGEVYEDHFAYPDSKRIKLMESLPLDIALQVGFFLTSCLDMYKTLFQSSHLPV